MQTNMERNLGGRDIPAKPCGSTLHVVNWLLGDMILVCEFLPHSHGKIISILLSTWSSRDVLPGARKVVYGVRSNRGPDLRSTDGARGLHVRELLPNNATLHPRSPKT
jgi:hypothetical protein